MPVLPRHSRVKRRATLEQACLPGTQANYLHNTRRPTVDEYSAHISTGCALYPPPYSSPQSPSASPLSNSRVHPRDALSRLASPLGHMSTLTPWLETSIAADLLLGAEWFSQKVQRKRGGHSRHGDSWVGLYEDYGSLLEIINSDHITSSLVQIVEVMT
jgi:hypothetical protein